MHAARLHPSWPFSPFAAACGVIACLAVVASGCANPAIRSQSPELEALAQLEADTKFVGDYTAPWGLNSKRIERPALVTGLADTGKR